MRWITHLILTFAAVACYAQEQMHGTTVILVKTKNAIYVGGDSFVSLQYYDSLKKATSVYNDLYCKLWHNGTCGVALIGSFLEINKQQAIKNIGMQLSSDSLMITHARYFKEISEEALNRWKRYDMPKFNAILQASRSSLAQVIYFGVESDTLFSKRLIFRLQPFGEKVEVEFIETNENVIAAGKIAAIQDSVYNDNTWREEGQILSKIEKLILVEADNFPTEVGGPVDLIVVKRSGSQWGQRKPGCN